MYKNSSDKQTYIERVASHATKEHASGRIDAVPADAEEPVAYFNVLHEQYTIMATNYKVLNAEATALRAKLKNTLTFEEYRRAQGQLDAIGLDMHNIQQHFAELRPLIRAAREDAKAAFCWHMAKTILQREDVYLIENQCEQFANTNVSVNENLRRKSVGEREGEQHVHYAKKTKHNLHRRWSRNNLEKAKREGLVMYANSDFRQDQRRQQTLTVPVETLKKKLAEHFNKK